MDAQTFDRLIAKAGRRPSRRAVIGVLSAALLGALLPARGSHAQNTDSDQDGLFDADETTHYGTRPDVADTDGDGFGDGQEICNRDRTDPNCQQDLIHTNPLVNEDAAQPPPPAPCPQGGTDCGGGVCASLATDRNNCGACGKVCPGASECQGGVCAVTCGPGLLSCGDYCADVVTDHGNCGGCGYRCSQFGQNYNCQRGSCVRVCSLYGETCQFGQDRQCCGDMVCIYGGYCVTRE